MNRKSMQLLIISSLSISLLLSGCNREKKSEQPNHSANSLSVQFTESTKQKQVEQEHQESLLEQGFTIDRVFTQNDGTTKLQLLKKGTRYIGIVNPDFEWSLKPTTDFKEIGEFSEGIAPAAINDTRQNRADKALLWGFINKKGEWVIKPQYARVGNFLDGMAIVVTLEEDRDDLSNSRTITINKEAKELFEIKEKYSRFTYTEAPEDSSQFKISNGYLITAKGIFNPMGKLIPLNYPKKYKVYGVMNNLVIIETEKDVMILDFNSNVVKTFENSYIRKDDNNYDMEQLRKNKLIIHSNSKNKDQLVDGNDFKSILESKEGNSLSLSSDGQLLTDRFDSDVKIYDLSGSILFDGKAKLVSNFFNGRAWSKGAEYLQLIDKTGKIIIDESLKLKSDFGNMVGPVIEMNQRPSKDSGEFVKCLVNIDSQKIVTFKELLNK